MSVDVGWLDRAVRVVRAVDAECQGCTRTIVAGGSTVRVSWYEDGDSPAVAAARVELPVPFGEMDDYHNALRRMVEGK